MHPSGQPTEIKVHALATADEMRARIQRKSKLKGRQADETSLAEVRALVGLAPHGRDLLIEHLHRLNDHYRCLFERHLVALAHARQHRRHQLGAAAARIQRHLSLPERR